MQMVILPARDLMPAYKSYYLATYDTYSAVWSKAFSELDKPGPIFSNDFTRQDYIVSIMDGATCAACSFFREVNISNPVHRQDSWFKEWDNEIFSNLLTDGLSKGLIYSYVTVHPNYRKALRPDFKALAMVGCLSMLQAQFDGFQLMFGATRNSHKMDEACASWGSLTLKSNVPYMNTQANLIVFTPSSVKIAQEKYPAETVGVFEQRLDFRDLNNHQPTNVHNKNRR